MVDHLEPLRKLQALDAQLYQLRREQRRHPLELGRARQALTEQEAAERTIDARLKALQVQQKDKELELATREATVKKLQAQLFQVKTNKEYAAMQREIEQSKADVSLLEEDILRLLDAVDRTAQESRAQQERLAKQQELFRAEESRTARALEELQRRITALEQERQTLTPSVNSEMLSVYERVLASREGVALVPLVNDSCGGCHMVQPPQVINEVSLKAKLVTCESCSRILYLDESVANA